MKRFMLCLLVLILFFLFSSCKHTPSLEEQYESLQEKYWKLEEQYYQAEEKEEKEENLSEKIWSFEDDSITVWCYFEGENDVSFDEAYDAYQRIRTLWSY